MVFDIFVNDPDVVLKSTSGVEGLQANCALVIPDVLMNCSCVTDESGFYCK